MGEDGRPRSGSEKEISCVGKVGTARVSAWGKVELEQQVGQNAQS